jgi:hypothetical protein
MLRALGLGTISYGKVSLAIVLTITVSLLLVSFPTVQAQTSTNFTRADIFSIPSRNSQINFAVNGSYSSANLIDNVWVFTDLQLNRNPTLNILKISVENSNLTILSYQTRNMTSRVVANERLAYRVFGEGKVTVNLGYSNAGQYGGSDWYVSKPGRNQTTFLSLGHDYSLKNDGTLIINGLTGNVSITHMFLDRFVGNNANLPFYQQHSVIITVAIVIVLTLAAVLVIRLRNKGVQSKLIKNGVFT